MIRRNEILATQKEVFVASEFGAVRSDPDTEPTWHFPKHTEEQPKRNLRTTSQPLKTQGSPP